MAERTPFQAPSILPDSVQGVQVDDGTAALFKNLSGTFLSTAQKAHQTQLRQDLDLAKSEGERIGLSEGVNFKPVRSPGLFAKQFNQSGIGAASIDMDLKTRENINRIALANPNNPDAQKTLMTEYADSFAAELPDEMRLPFRRTFNPLMSAQILSSQKRVRELGQQQAKANFALYEDATFQDIEQYAPLMLEQGELGEQSAAVIGQMRQNYIELITEDGPGIEFDLGGYKIPGKPGASGAFDIKDIAEKLQEFDIAVTQAAVKGEFVKELERGRGVAQYFNFVKGNTQITQVEPDGTLSHTKISDVLRNEDMEKVASFMRTHISTLNSIEAAEDRKADRVIEKHNDALVREAYQASLSVEKDAEGNEFLVGDPNAVLAARAQAANDPLVDPDTFEALDELAETVGTGQINNPVIEGDTRNKILNRVIQSPSGIPREGLGDKESVELRSLLSDINRSNHFTKSVRYVSGRTIAKNILAPEASLGFAFGPSNTEKAAQRVAEFETRFANEAYFADKMGLLPTDINALPGENQFDFEARAREIAKDILDEEAEGKKANTNVEAIKAKQKEITDKMDQTSNRKEAKKLAEELRKVQRDLGRAQQGIKVQGYE